MHWIKPLRWIGTMTAVAWCALALAFLNERLSCTPVTKCGATYWEKFGNLILLHWVVDPGAFVIGLLALVAAVAGARLVYSQILLAKDQEGERLARRLAAERAVSPLALDEISEYAESCVNYLKLLHSHSHPHALPRGIITQSLAALDIPAMPIAASDAVVRMVEALPTSVSAPWAKVLGALQVNNARLRATKRILNAVSSSPEMILRINIEQYMIDAADLHARAGMFFDYARFRSENIPKEPLSYGSILNALGNMGLRSHDYPDMFVTVRRQYP